MRRPPFFLCLAPHSANASTNWWEGTVFGTNISEATSISSLEHGDGSLIIGFGGTTNLALGHRIEGTISITNGFDRFSLQGTGSVVSNTADTVLRITGGKNLFINGGEFRGLGSSTDGGGSIPPIGSATAAVGAIFSGTSNIVVSKALITGGTYLPNNAITLGTDGIQATDTTLVFTDDGTDSSTVIGGNGGELSWDGAGPHSMGGHGLNIGNSTLIISNGTFKGGNGGDVSTDSDFIGASWGGHAIDATNSTIEIHSGTFTGGDAGSITDTHNNPENRKGGSALYVENSDVTIHGGTFKAGATGRDDTYAFYSLAYGEGSVSNKLLGGTFDSIGFGGGRQFITLGTNLVVNGVFGQNGGILYVDNQSDAPLQNTEINSGTLLIENDFTLGSGGSITLNSGYSEIFFENLAIQSGAIVDTGTGRIEAHGNLDVQKDGTLAFKIDSTSITDRGIAVGSNVTFHSGSALQADIAWIDLNTETNALWLVSATNQLNVVDSGGATNVATTATFTNNVDIQVTTAALMELEGISVEDGKLLVLLLSRQPLNEYWNASGDMARLADELDAINDPDMMATIVEMDDPEASAYAVEQTYFTKLNTFQVAMNGLKAAVGQSVSRGTEFREKLLLPTGSNGPEGVENDWRFWMKYHGQFLNHDGDDQNSAYEATTHGGVFGADKSFGRLLVGISGGAGRNSIDADNGAEEDMNAAHAAIYSTIGKNHSYLDAGLAYGYNGVESHTPEPFRLDGEYDSHLVGGYVGGGIGFDIPKISTVITPEASAQYTLYQQEAYTETGTAAVPRSFDEFDADSLRTSLGLNVAMHNTKATQYFGFKIEGRAHWLHEFNPDPGHISFQLEGGTGNTYALAYPMLDEDAVRLGIGVSFFNTAKRKPKNILLRLDFDELIGENFNSHNLSAKAIYAF